ncbi:mastermind-like domain-containing protein 1 isoform X2 [Dromiciops gliroides]|uniref:mastermind-like domain-containing protein 1 isoform X2 n=1 Tax=Dromiciops gliroides TaxID=33562 RepID=UPI001CC7DA80|nr:mastermind-like domain-containing protein 1 isoform X2 [Dromiciops gliroides]XP_043830268.1 mastermind-like domain-containing protein 1 isoform X2 [Dromiciops gliroides]
MSLVNSQGSIKRKLEGDNFPDSSSFDDLYPHDIKRPCLDDVTLSMGQSTNPSSSCSDIQMSPFPLDHNSSSIGMADHSVLLENNQMNDNDIGSSFTMPSNTEVGQKGPMGAPDSMVHYEEKGNSLQTVDQELQDLLEELTKMPDPSPNDLDLENLLGSKAEEPLGIVHTPPALRSTPKPSPQTPHLENHVTSKEFSPSCSQTVTSGSPQMRPSSAGASYPVRPPNKPTTSPVSSTAQTKCQPRNMLTGSLPTLSGPHWHHAHQLKALAASKQVSSTKQQMPASSWSTMASPPYPPGSSPHQQPYSPQNIMVSGISSTSLPGSNLQTSPTALLSNLSVSGNSTAGTSGPFGSEMLSSPILAQQQQQFSPPNVMLSNLTSTAIPTTSIKSPSSSLVSSMATTNPSSPYRPDKLSSPALHQQSFSPQGALISNVSNPAGLQQQPPPPPPPQPQPQPPQPPQPQNPLYKTITNNPSKNLNVILQQASGSLQSGLVSEGPGSQEPFSFGNTKPLSHFTSEAGPPKVASMAASSGQPSLLHYLQQPPQAQQVQAQQPNNTQFLLQQMMQQPQRTQRHMSPASLPSQPRQDGNPGIAARLQEAGSLQSAASSIPAATPATVNGCMRNHLLKQQILRRQHIMQQEKQRPNVMAVPSDQRTSFLCQQMSQFSTMPQQMPSDCGQSMPTPSPNPRRMSSTPGILQNTLNPGISSTTGNQSTGGMVMIPQTPGKQQGIFPSASDFNVTMRQNVTSASLSSASQTVHSSHSAVKPGMTLTGFTPSSLANQSASPHQLRQPTMARISNMYPNSSPQAWISTVASRMPSQGQIDTSIQQFSTNPLFSKQNVRSNLTGQQFSPQSVIPPNQIAPGVRQIPKVSVGQSAQSINLLTTQSLRQSLTRTPLPAMNVMKPIPQSVSSFNPISPAQGIEPPSYPVTSQASGTFSRMGASAELPQYDFGPQQNDSMLPDSCSETDFIDSLMKSSSNNDEEWLNNLRMIDDILGQHTQSSGHV